MAARRKIDTRSRRQASGRKSPARTVDDRTDPREGLALGYHAVRAVLQNDPQKADKLLLARDQRDGRTRQLVRLAREGGVPFLQVPKAALDRLAEGLPHQGVAIRLSGVDLMARDELIEVLDDQAIVLVVDGVTDPRNLGAMLRSAAAMHASGMFLPTHRSAGLTPGALRSAAGAAVRVPVARSGNASQLLEKLDEAFVRPVGLVPSGGKDPWEVDLTGKIALVIGGEEKGVRPGLRGKCADLITIPMSSSVESLNVSVAVGIVLAEAVRQRQGQRPLRGAAGDESSESQAEAGDKKP